MYDIILKDGQCVLSKDHKLRTEQVDIAIKDGQIAAIGSLQGKEALSVIKAKDLHVLPGLIDTQVHFREPGMEHKEDLSSGTKGAIRGGITGVLEMPNTLPPTIDVQSFEDKISRAKNRAWCNYGFFIGACPSNLDNLSDLENLEGCCGIKIFVGSSTGTLLLCEDKDILKALQNGKRRVALHCEDEHRIQSRLLKFKDKGDVSFHPVWRDEESALKATERILKLARQADRSVHILHVTTAQEMELLKKNKDICTVECTPQHLILSAPDCYKNLKSFAQMNPPIREKKHQDKLWQALQEGVVDMIGSDHAPHTREEKQKIWPKSPSGMPGVQTTVPLMLNCIHKGQLSLHQLVQLMAANPSLNYKIKNKGFIEVGKDADFTLVDLKKQDSIKESWIDSKVGWTPFDKMKITGWPQATILGGRVVMNDGEIIGDPQGEVMSFS